MAWGQRDFIQARRSDRCKCIQTWEPGHLGKGRVKWRQLPMALSHSSQGWAGNSLFKFLSLALLICLHWSLCALVLPSLTFIRLGIIPCMCSTTVWPIRAKPFSSLIPSPPTLFACSAVYPVASMEMSSNQLRTCKLPTLEISRPTILFSDHTLPLLSLHSLSPRIPREH